MGVFSLFVSSLFCSPSRFRYLSHGEDGGVLCSECLQESVRFATAMLVQAKRLPLLISAIMVLVVAGVVAHIDLPMFHTKEMSDTEKIFDVEISVGAEGSAAFDSLSSRLGTDRDTVHIEARGRKFAWTFLYPGPDHILGTNDDVLIDRDLRLPQGVRVKLTLESDDYIYTLSCPSLDLKEIAIPDLTYTLQFDTTSVEGTHPLITDPMCGWRAQHDDLMGNIVVESEGEPSQGRGL